MERWRICPKCGALPGAIEHTRTTKTADYEGIRTEIERVREFLCPDCKTRWNVRHDITEIFRISTIRSDSQKSNDSSS